MLSSVEGLFYALEEFVLIHERIAVYFSTLMREQKA